MFKDSLIYVVEQLLKKNNIFFDKQELAFQIQSHPSYPSLHAITGVLDHFNIDNIAAAVPTNLETLLELPNCFIGQIETNKGKELVTVDRKGLDYILFHPSQEKEKNTELLFLEKFTGIIVAVENSTIEKKQKFNYENIVLVGVLSLITIGILLISKPTVLASLFFFTSLIGILISISIYKQELGMSSLIGDAFCGSSGEKKDCDAVLSSKGATIYKEYKLSDFSLLYFLGLGLSTFLMILKNSSLDILYIISILVLPITAYSIYYQFKVVKKWCFLCLSIVCVLWLQTSFSVFENGLNIIFNFKSILIVAFSFSLIFFIWNFLKPKLKEFQENKKAKIESFKFKRNYTLFSSLLNSSKKIKTQLKNVPEIVFGNKDSLLEIVIITNPFCGHCKPVHKMVENILHKYKDDVKIIIRFNVNTTNIESDGVIVASRLLEIHQKEGVKGCLTAMSQIYEGESVSNWSGKWGGCYEKEWYIGILEKESVWCNENEINFTPEVLINGQSFPKEYNRSDLVYFIEELHEDYSELEGEQIVDNYFKLTT